MKISSSGKPKPAFLTLSKDKFTIYVTTNKFKSGKVGNLSSIRRPLLRKVTSIGSTDEESDERSVDIGSLDRVQRGQNTYRFELARKISSRLSSPKNNKSINSDPSRSFSIIFGGERTIDITVSDPDVSRDEIVQALDGILYTYGSAKTRVGNDVFLLRHCWTDADKDQNDSINATELSEVLNRINYFMKKSDIDKFYNSFGKMIGLDRSGRRKGLSFEQCVTILHKIKRDSSWQVKPVRQIWFDLFGEYMNNGKSRTRVSVESFLKKFMWKKQGESHFTPEDVESLFRKLNRLEFAQVASNLNIDDKNAGMFIDKDRFEAYLVSKDNDIFDPNLEKFDPDTMTRSLSEYWINSSHNTYLTGDQFQSRSSVEMYLNALYRGCRCLELDCFDGHRTQSGAYIPLVYHGLTITGKILFHDIIEGIKFFLNNNPGCYPIILSLENHCSLPFQDAMADFLVSILDDSLYVPDDKSLYDPLPSPEKLKGMVLIKGKRLTDQSLRSQDSEDTDDDSDSEIEEEHKAETDNNISSRTKTSSQESTTTSTTTATSSAISPNLSRITIFHGIRLESFAKNAEKSKDNMLSFDESKARKYCRNEMSRKEWLAYNKTHLSRVYPSAKRVDSSNFSPITGWSTGCQLMALNFQTSDAARRLNDGRFRQNGNCGYVLKPPTLSDSPSETMKLSIKVLCGSCLPKPKGSKKGECIDPYVHICLYDIPMNGGKELATGHYTHHVVRNGFNPIWAQETIYKFKVYNPDVAMLQFTVWDRDVATTDDFVGSSSVPISCIREGYRNVRIFDANNKQHGAFERASLLVEVIMKKGQQIQMW